MLLRQSLRTQGRLAKKLHPRNSIDGIGHRRRRALAAQPFLRPSSLGDRGTSPLFLPEHQMRGSTSGEGAPIRRCRGAPRHNTPAKSSPWRRPSSVHPSSRRAPSPSRHLSNDGLTGTIATWTGEDGLGWRPSSSRQRWVQYLRSDRCRSGTGGWELGWRARGARLFFLPKPRTKMTRVAQILEPSRWSAGCS